MVLTELKRALPGKVFDTVIRENVRMRECPASGKSIMAYATDSHAAEDYRALAREMMAFPDKWRQPVVLGADAGADDDGRGGVDQLRANAAARIRAASGAPDNPLGCVPSTC